MAAKLEIAPKPAASVGDLSDDELMLLVAGDRRAPFNELVRRHQQMVLSYADRYIGDRNLAIEAAQETFLTLWNDRQRYRGEGKFASYLLSIAHNRARHASRKRKGQWKRKERLTQEVAAAPTAQPSEPLDALLEQERARQVRAQLQQLDPATREVLVLRFTNELSYEEMSRVTGRRVGTLKSQVSRGVAKLRGLLPQEHRA